VEVTFELDANGILNVAAEDKGTGKREAIVITNDKGRLSREEIDRMVADAERFADEDKKIKERIEARNGLEQYAYNVRASIDDSDKLADKLEDDDKDAVRAAVTDALEWLETHTEADKEDYDAQLKDLEKVVNPIFSKVYAKSGGGAPGGSDEDMGHDEL
jgi:heat shock protein 5